MSQGCDSGLQLYFIEKQEQNQTSASLPSTVSPTLAFNGNGSTYEGKIRILHHYSANFTCEGRKSPESILVRQENLKWYMIQNTSDQCGEDLVLIENGVIYEEQLNQAVYLNKLYIPPTPYFVDVTANPHLPDVNLTDGLCANQDGACSLQASLDQANVTSLTAPVIIEIPQGTYSLTEPLKISLKHSNHQSITMRGAAASTTLIHGSNITSHLMIGNHYSIPLHLERLTFQNGRSSNLSPSSSISGNTFILQSLQISDCIFKNNQGAPVILAGAGSGDIHIKKTQFINNGDAGIRILNARNVLIEESFFSGNGDIGILIQLGTARVRVLNSTISDNKSVGLIFSDCVDCQIENSTIFRNQGSGLVVSSSYDIAAHFELLDPVIKNTTIYRNGTTSLNNIVVNFTSQKPNSLRFENSIIATENPNHSNCSFPNGNGTHNIIANHSLFSDSSCQETGLGVLRDNPQLGILQVTGAPPLLIPKTGSPVIDSGQNEICTTKDQRGFLRPINKLGNGVLCDMGAIEVQLHE